MLCVSSVTSSWNITVLAPIFNTLTDPLFFSFRSVWLRQETRSAFTILMTGVTHTREHKFPVPFSRPPTSVKIGPAAKTHSNFWLLLWELCFWAMIYFVWSDVMRWSLSMIIPVFHFWLLKGCGIFSSREKPNQLWGCIRRAWKLS